MLGAGENGNAMYALSLGYVVHGTAVGGGKAFVHKGGVSVAWWVEGM